ncbi:MAG: isochorismatase family cysteine hydrolase [Bacillota bacterium]|nr:isochorismatase family cysteine hydrolase [Bacillota bacterium]
MKDILVVVDMQNDFVSGSLGTDEAKKIVGPLVDLVENFQGDIYFTRDSHGPDYLKTQEGKNLPVEHCIKNTPGWEIIDQLKGYVGENVVDKVTFGSRDLIEILEGVNKDQGIKSITLAGLCTDICVISNALALKAFLPEVPIKVVEGACAGVSPESHKRALAAMEVCQIQII